MKHNYTYRHSERSEESTTTPTCHCDETKQPKQSSHSEPLGEESPSVIASEAKQSIHTESHKDISATPQYDGETNPQYDKIDSTPCHCERSAESTESSAPQTPQPPNNGWDIIIGNPPYIQVPKGVYSAKIYPYSEGKDKNKQNLYKVFVEHAYNLITKESGILCVITQSSIMCDLSASYTRELLLTKTRIKQIIEFPKKAPTKEGQVFKSALQGTCILLCQRHTPKNESFKLSIHNDKITIKHLEFENVTQEQILHFYPQRFEIPLIKKGEMALINKLKSGERDLLEDLLEGTLQGNINTIHLDKIRANDNTGYFIIKGENIHRYSLENNFINCKITDQTENIVQSNQNKHYIIAMQGITGTTDTNRIHCTLLKSKNTKFVFLDSTKMLFLLNASIAKFLVGILNSKTLDWLFRKTSTNNNVNIYELESLPIPKITEFNQNLANEIISLVEQILESKAKDSNSDTSELESQIDSLVYKLYNLTESEIQIIEGGK